ncbi:MAG: putative aldo/keto reductase-like oxidoreductase [Myxococcota bacterium]|jgi:predicted aldo/keto reductase-like oxidoreductase
MDDFNDPITLAGDLITRRMGVGADAGIDARALEWGFERGLNYFYWGTQRTAGMKQAIRTLAPQHREKMVIALQTYDTTGLMSGLTFRRGLTQLKIDYADVLILGKRDGAVTRRAQDGALALKEAGLVKHLCVSAHDRSTYRAHLESGIYDIIMVRYNCAHPGAEQDVFPLLGAYGPRPSVIAYNSTRWGHLFDAKWMPQGERTPEPTDLYRHALTNPNVDMVLTAPSTEAQLVANIEALDRGPLDADEMQWLSRVGKHVHGLNPNTNWDFLFSSRGPSK